jgi:tRNA pseudouridine55 synthase
VEGLLVVDKPPGMTSHDVVARVRRLARTRRVGHAGTLDPMATGVLVLGVERGTRLLTYLVGSDKRYSATMRLGRSTVTDDSEGDVTDEASAAGVTGDAVRAAAAAFVGEIDQVPSAVSAVKIAGVRSYARVRRGELVDLPARRVRVDRLDIGDVRTVHDGAMTLLDVDAEVSCSSGTYVRAIARDLGAALGVGGHLTALRRTAVGQFTLDQAVTLEELGERDDSATIPLGAAVERLLARRDADAAEARALSHGGPLSAVGLVGPYGVFAPDGRVLAIVSEREGRARPEVVLAPAGSEG